MSTTPQQLPAGTGKLDAAWPEAAGRSKAKKGLSLAAQVRRDAILLLLALPGLLCLLIFHYIPTLGSVIAFQDYLPFIGFVHSRWVGLENFSYLLTDRAFWTAARNTLVIWTLQLLLDFPAPIILALILNGLINPALRRAIQSIVVLPHFISWVVIVGLYQQIFGRTGGLNHLLTVLGLPHVDLVSNPAFFKWMVTAQLLWKETGWGTIIYLAALLNIDAALYEAAAVDGAGWFRRMWHVTLPGITGVVMLFLILRIAFILSTGGEQILLQRSQVGPAAGEVLFTYTYFHGIAGGQWAVATAAGLMNGVCGLLLILGSQRIARIFGYGVFGR